MGVITQRSGLLSRSTRNKSALQKTALYFSNDDIMKVLFDISNICLLYNSGKETL